MEDRSALCLPSVCLHARSETLQHILQQLLSWLFVLVRVHRLQRQNLVEGQLGCASMTSKVVECVFDWKRSASVASWYWQRVQVVAMIL